MQNAQSVVLVGRMNVGKSTLFNRLSTNVKSLTLDYAGVTRDFLKDIVTWHGSSFELIDSGGITTKISQEAILKKVRESVIHLIEAAGVVILVADATVGLLPEDREIARLLHKLKKRVIVAVNKVDSLQAGENVHEFNQLGFSAVIPLSAEHGTGIAQLLDVIIEQLPAKTAEQQKPAYRVVLLGRPNVGKSSLMNALLEVERSIVSELPGTTREAVSEYVNFYKETLELTDTAGVRRKRAIGGKLEPLMVKSSMAALKKADIVVLLIDAHEHTLVDQDLKLAFYAFSEQYKALILLINKQDLLTEFNQEELERRFDYYKHLIKKIPILQISCKTGKNVGKVLPLIKKVWERANQEFSDVELTRLLKDLLVRKPQYHQSKLLMVYKVKQIGRAPLTLLLEVNEPLWFGESQLSFLENELRSHYDLKGIPIKFIAKKSVS